MQPALVGLVLHFERPISVLCTVIVPSREIVSLLQSIICYYHIRVEANILSFLWCFLHKEILSLR